MSDVSSSYAPAFPPSARLPVDARFFLGVDDLATASLYSHLNLFLKFPSLFVHMQFVPFKVCPPTILNPRVFHLATPLCLDRLSSKTAPVPPKFLGVL